MVEMQLYLGNRVSKQSVKNDTENKLKAQVHLIRNEKFNMRDDLI